MMKKYTSTQVIGALDQEHGGPDYVRYAEEVVGTRMGRELALKYPPIWEYDPKTNTHTGRLELMVGTVEDFAKAREQAKKDGQIIRKADFNAEYERGVRDGREAVTKQLMKNLLG